MELYGELSSLSWLAALRSSRKVLDKMKKNKLRTVEDSGWVFSEGRCAHPHACTTNFCNAHKFAEQCA